MIKVFQDLLDHKFRLSVRIGCGQRKIFKNRHRLRAAVNGRGRRKHKVFHAALAHAVDENERGIKVVVVIRKRDFHTFANRFQPCEVDYVGGFFVLEDFE